MIRPVEPALAGVFAAEGAHQGGGSEAPGAAATLARIYARRHNRRSDD